MFELKFPVHIPPPRRAEQTLLPAALVALLGLLLAVQLAAPSSVAFPDFVVGRSLRLAPLVVAPLLVDAEITQRPLFAPGRHETAVDGIADRAAPLEGARVVGAISIRGAVSIFLQAPDGQVTSVRLGGRYRGWRLMRIAGGQSLFLRGAESVSLPITASAPPVMPDQAKTEEPEEETP